MTQPALLHGTQQPSSAVRPSGILQRKCACDSSPKSECRKCGDKASRGPDGTTIIGRPSRLAMNFAGTPLTIQTKLAISEPGDSLEQEADRLAEHVMHTSDPYSTLSTSEPMQTARVQRRVSGAKVGLGEAPQIVHEMLSSPGQPLDSANRAFFESRFRHDFSQVRIHADGVAARSAEAVGANAFTVANKVVFNKDKYVPNSAYGKKLLAHELAHVVQQSRGGASPRTDGDSGLESAADRAATAVANSGTVTTVSGASGVGIARDAKPSEQVLYEVKFPDGIKRLTALEFEAQKQETTRRLRSRLRLVADLAELGRNSQIDMLKEYHGGVESLSDVFHKPKSLIGIAADIKAGVTPPYIGMWSHAKNTSQEGLTALDRGDIAAGARLLSLADSNYRDSQREWNAYRAATIGGAEAVASDLETVRDVSFAIALVAAAIIAAPVIAGAVGAGGLGVTGVTATGLTAAGTAGTTGVLGAGLGGGSTALASYANTGKVDWKATSHDASKFGKQGAVTGLTAGLGSAIGASGKAAELAKPLVQQALRRCLTEAGVNVTGEITTAALDKALPSEPPTSSQQEGAAQQAPQVPLPGPVRTALTGCVGGALGVPINKLGNVGARKGVDLAVGAGISYADARLSGQGNKGALSVAAQSIITSSAIQHAQPHSNHPAAKKNTVLPTQKSDTPTKVTQRPVRAVAPGYDEPAKTSIAEKATGQIKIPTSEDGAPAIFKEDAIARKPTADGHEAVVTKQGVGICSPSPCPVIHLEYAKELAEYPKLKEWNAEIQALRKTDPNKAAEEAASLIRTLEATRSNATKRTPSDDIDRAFDEATPPNVEKKGGRRYLSASDEHDSDRKRIPREQKSRLDLQHIELRSDERTEKYPHLAAVKRVRTVQGKSIADHPKLKKLWEAAAAKVTSKQELNSQNYKDLYNKTRDEFWQSVRANKEAAAIFEISGFEFDSGKAPLLKIKESSQIPVEERRVSLDHNVEKAIDWRLALTASNLTFEFQTPNSNREAVQMRHPELRPERPE